jgi:hypothetical protein
MGGYDMNLFGIGTTLGGLAFAGALMISGSAEAQSSAYAQSSSKDPAACTEACQNERNSCLAQMGTPEMCSVDHRACVKTCQSK